MLGSAHRMVSSDACQRMRRQGRPRPTPNTVEQPPHRRPRQGASKCPPQRHSPYPPTCCTLGMRQGPKKDRVGSAGRGVTLEKAIQLEENREGMVLIDDTFTEASNEVTTKRKHWRGNGGGEKTLVLPCLRTVCTNGLLAQLPSAAEYTSMRGEVQASS